MYTKKFTAWQEVHRVLFHIWVCRPTTPTTPRDVCAARKKAMKDAAKETGLTLNTIRDKCVRELGLRHVTEFDRLVYEWLTSNSKDLRDKIEWKLGDRHGQSLPVDELEDIGEFFLNPGNWPPDGDPLLGN